MNLPDAFSNPLGLDKGQDTTDFDKKVKEVFDVNMAILKVFSTKEGKKVLEWMSQKTLNSPSWLPSIALQSGMEAACAHGFAREGQNALVRDIVDRMESAKQCKQPNDVMYHITGENL